MDTESRVNEEVYYGTIPILPKERIYGFWDTLLIMSGFAIATWCYVQGGYIATIAGIKEIIFCTIFGATLAGLILCLSIIATNRYGIDLWFYQRAVFGYRGLIVVWLLIFSATWGYEAIDAIMYGNAIILLFKAGGINLATSWNPWIATTCILFGWWIAIKGPVAVKTSTYIMVPSLMLVGLIIVFLVFSQYSLMEILAMKPINAGNYGNRWETYMLILEWNIAFVIAWYPNMGGIPRLVKTERKSYWAHVFACATVMGVFIIIGALTGMAMSQVTGTASTDPTEWLVKLGGPKLGLLSLVFICVANVTTQAVATYTLTVSTKVLKPDWDYKKVATFWSLYCILLVFWPLVWKYYTTFLALVGAISGPAIALIIVDFFILRKQKFSLRSLYRSQGSEAYNYTAGFNIPALIAFFAGMVCYYSVYDPIATVPKSGIFYFTTATGLAMIVSGGIYVVLSRFKWVNQYLRKDLHGDFNGLDGKNSYHHSQPANPMQ
ncbi:cytosine permease [Candidatus Formimonas warabiya]|uniref:Uncharacterized protein n=1 Tax=Formimonas warabiya TaxID=1761012 RepID=A0A3G1KUP0_FORW1|nr:cytosine permease [Candidatus Formimonas warabiya]ATW26223.1 hypothetical protein DCMF_16935 [Candidatus Formimonas warabiya]